MAESVKKADVSAAVVEGELVVTFAGGDKLVVNQHAMTADIREAAMWHGFKQKLIDAAAIGRNPETGKSATIVEKFAAVREVYERLLAGQWNKAREGGTSSETAILIEALTRVYPSKTREWVTEWIGGKSKAERDALTMTAKVKPVLDEIKADRAATIDTDSILSELEALSDDGAEG